MNSDQNIKEVLSYYPIPTRSVTIEPVKTGLIHNSYKIHSKNDKYFLQQINTDVFNDVAGLMNNIALVTNSLSESYKNSPFETLQILRTNEGELYKKTDNEAWRIYLFKDHLIGYDTPTNREMVKEAGIAFARFVKSLSAVDPSRLSVTIPDFHSMEYRLFQLREASGNRSSLLSGVRVLKDQIDHYSQLLLPLEYAMKNGELPMRVTHNDSKFNNLLFDEDGKARCVVDLDTVMPGIIHFDVGDCLRTLTPTTAEDESDLEKIELRAAYQGAFLEGYTGNASGWLTTEELNYLPYAAPYMALIMGIRFLTDHLNGNVYYSCDYPEHNLVRAKNQAEVTRQFLDRFPLS